MKHIKKIFLLFVFAVTLYACENKKYEHKDIVGYYANFDNTDNDDYTTLTLRSDSTYCLVQCTNDMDIFFEYFGVWKLNDNEIILFEGKNIADYLIVKTIKNHDTDTLNIKINERLYDYLPNLQISIDEKEGERDLLIKNGAVAVIKYEFLDTDWKKNNKTYEYLAYSIYLRNDNYYSVVSDAFVNSHIEISLKDDSFLTNEKKEFVRYSINNDFITLKTKTDKLNKNKLVKE